MEYKLMKDPDTAIVNEVRNRLREYNKDFWEVLTKPQFALTVTKDDRLVGGIIFSLFGEWLEVEFLWVEQDLRRCGIGKELLSRAESCAKEYGCKTAVVNTMNFQAKPFYEKHGFIVQYTQKNYPKTSTRYYLEKNLQFA